MKRFASIKRLIERRPLLTAVILGVIATLLISGYLDRREAELLGMTEPVDIVIASRDVKYGEVINQNFLTYTKIPLRLIQPGSFKSIEEVSGSISAVPIMAGTQLTSAHVRDKRLAGAVSSIIKEGSRAITISIDDESGSLGIIRPGDGVDLLGTFDLGRESAANRTTLVVAENVKVVAVSGRIYDLAHIKDDESRGQGPFSKLKDKPYSRSKTLLTLEGAPAIIQKIAFAKNSGYISVALRSIGDESQLSGMKPSTIRSITGGYDELRPIRNKFREYRGE